MKMNMVDRLARACIHVEHGAIAFLMDLELFRKFLGNLKDVSDERVIFRFKII